MFEAEIKRFDLCIDVLIPFETMDLSVYQPRVATESKFRQGDYNLYLGKKPNVTTVYRKQLDPSRFDYGDNTSAPEEDKIIEGTRIEVRLYAKSVPIKSLAEIYKLRDTNPFEKLKCKTLDLATLTPLDDVKLNRLRAFLFRRAEVGMQRARREFSRNRNFNRDIGRHLEPLLPIDFGGIHQMRFERFGAPSQVVDLTKLRRLSQNAPRGSEGITQFFDNLRTQQSSTSSQAGAP